MALRCAICIGRAEERNSEQAFSVPHHYCTILKNYLKGLFESRFTDRESEREKEILTAELLKEWEKERVILHVLMDSKDGPERLELSWSEARSQEPIQGPSTWIIFHCFSSPQTGSWIRNGAARTQTHTCICPWCFSGRGIACGAILVPVWQDSNQKTPGIISSVKVDTMVPSVFLLCFV